YLFPVLAGTIWFLTLASMLSTWIVRGRPRYKELTIREHNSFISDIGAFQLKPVFLIGGILTAFFFTSTMVVVHLSRYDERMYSMQMQDMAWKRWVSAVAMSSGIVAGLGLILLTIFDTFRFHQEHAVLLLVCFVGLVSCMLLTVVVYFDQMWNHLSPSRRLRAYCLISTAIVAVDFVLGVAFYTLLQLSFWRTSGILEWVMAFTGAFYLWTF
ncbi:hypothetical protein DM02DRAFT_475062, partial [Periconia macrospinosa]